MVTERFAPRPFFLMTVALYQNLPDLACTRSPTVVLGGEALAGDS